MLAASAPLMIIAGPGTGKTRTLAHRIAHQIGERGAAPESLPRDHLHPAGRRELRERLACAPADRWPGREAPVTTFHGLRPDDLAGALPSRPGWRPGFQVADDAARLAAAAELAGSRRAARRLLASAAADPAQRELYVKALLARNLVDFDGLVELPVAPCCALTQRWPAARAVAADQRGRVPGHRCRAVRAAAAAGGRRPGAYRHRGSGSGHLRLPRRGRGLLPAFRGRLSRRHHPAADQELPRQPRHCHRRAAGDSPGDARA